MPFSEKSRFALFFGNRGFFPASLQAQARKEMKTILESQGHSVLMLDEDATRYGAIETVEEGQKYARFLKQHEGEYDGVVLCLPNFGDENGAVAALREVNVPIMIQAYPDELDKMAPEVRRDAFCGKFSIMDMFHQNDIPFTALKPHTVHPDTETFQKHITYFDQICRTVKGMNNVVIGALGSRTTAFKTVRIDEVALQHYGITVETFDLSDIFFRMEKLDNAASEVKERATFLRDYTSWDDVPDAAFGKLVKLSVVIDQMIGEYQLDAIAIRCWIEMQQQLGISPCVLLSEINDRGTVAACELDIGNAVTMHALKNASGTVATCLDWNNNYGDDENACILFHCGPVPQSMMKAKGNVTDHAILANAVGKGCSWGCNVGRIAPTQFTFGSMLTEDGIVKFYVGQGAFGEDPVPADFFGCAGVAKIPNLQNILQTIGYAGYRHHVSVTPLQCRDAVVEAFDKYLGYEAHSL